MFCSGQTLVIEGEQRNDWLIHDGVSLCRQARVQCRDLGSLQPRLPGSSDSSASASRIAGITGARHHARLIFLYFWPGAVGYTCNPALWEAEASGSPEIGS
ncbi:hypothetical protein AAY473_024854 [Plecturocebus cupreus]